MKGSCSLPSTTSYFEYYKSPFHRGIALILKVIQIMAIQDLWFEKQDRILQTGAEVPLSNYKFGSLVNQKTKLFAHKAAVVYIRG